MSDTHFLCLNFSIIAFRHYLKLALYALTIGIGTFKSIKTWDKYSV